MMRNRTILLLMFALAPGCKQEPAQRDQTQAAPASTPAQAASGAPATAPAPTKARPAKKAVEPIPEDQALAFVASWLDAQNRGDFAAYGRLYSDDMTGVRRSGDKTVRLSRAGWMAERGRMFERPMVVSAERYSFAMRESGLHVYFTQRWESGSYKDVGRKVLLLRRTPKASAAPGLAIHYEEMLDSLILPQSSGAARRALASSVAPRGADVAVSGLGLGSRANEQLQLAFVRQGDVYLARLDTDIGHGPIQELYHNEDKASGHVEAAAATRQVARSAEPKLIAAVRGLGVTLYNKNLEVACQARLGDAFTLLAEDWLESPAYREDAAAELWAQGKYMVIAAIVDAPAKCLEEARFARDARLPPLGPGPANLGVAERDHKLLRAELDEMIEHEKEHSLEPPELLEYSGELAAHPAPDTVLATLSTGVLETCKSQESHGFTLYRATRNAQGFWDFSKVFETAQQETFIRALDVDGDGVLEMLTSRGLAIPGHAEYSAWLPDLRVYWPPGLACDGCDDDDC